MKDKEVFKSEESEVIFLHTRPMETKEYKERLLHKLFEEAQELQEASLSDSPVHVKEECADLLEVLLSVASLYGFSLEEIESTRKRKKEERGGFEKRLYSAYVKVSSGHPALAYYLERKEQYPEIESPLSD